MGWERRKNHWYYTRTRRENGQVVRTYFGRGPEAEAAAAEDVQRRQQEFEERREVALFQAKLARHHEMLDRYYAQVKLLVRAYMVIEGYHYHRGEWRKRRGFDRAKAEYEARQREQREQEAAAAQAKQRPRRPMPSCRQRNYGPGLVRRPLHLHTRVAKAIVTSPLRQQGGQVRRPRISIVALRARVANALRNASHGRRRSISRRRRVKQGSAPRPPP